MRLAVKHRRLVTLALASFALLAGNFAWAQRAPIKLGLFVPLTGPLAANGKEMVPTSTCSGTWATRRSAS